MDPVSAIGLAASVVQVTHFAGNLISKTRQLHSSLSGKLVEQEELETIVRSLESYSRTISTQLGTYKGKSSQSGNDSDLVTLCQSVRGVCKDLVGAIESLKTSASSSRWESFRQALRTVWKEKDIEDLVKRLEQHRSQINILLLANIKDRLEFWKQESETRDALIEQNLARIISSLGGEKKWQADLISAVSQSMRGDGRTEDHTDLVSTSLSVAAKLERDKLLERQTIASLKFPDIRDRYERISEAHKKTLEWIFDDSHCGSHFSSRPWESLSIWLMCADKPLYWVTGKPGAGKSTLMKFILDDKRLKERLRVWNRDLPMYLGSFFFWNSGTTMQMSRIGLLQSLLYQTISLFPHEVRRLFPERWEYQELFGYDRRPWTWLELSSAFSTMVLDPTRAFFFLIDGLDEFDGDCEELAAFLLQTSSQQSNIKLCLSSRPWLVFEDAFRLRPSLRVEDLTTRDIQVFASETLNRSQMFAQLRACAPGQAENLVSSVSELASGVFLWVRLVVKSLLDGLRDGDTVADLQARLLKLPRDLEDLFERIISDLSPEYFLQGSQIFRTVRASHLPFREIRLSERQVDSSAGVEPDRWSRGAWSPLSLLSLSFIGEDPRIALSACGAMPIQEQTYRSERMRRHLHSRCKGLLEAPSFNLKGPETKVEYLHRTVKDFLEEDRGRRLILSEQIPEKDRNVAPHLDLCAALLRHVCAIAPTEDNPASMNAFSDLLGQFVVQCHWLERQGRGEYVPFLTEMDRVVVTILNPDGEPVAQDEGPEIPHWTRRVDEYVGAKVLGIDSICDYAVYRGLTHFVRGQLRNGWSLNDSLNYQFLTQHVLANDEEMAEVLNLHQGVETRKNGDEHVNSDNTGELVIKELEMDGEALDSSQSLSPKQSGSKQSVKDGLRGFGRFLKTALRTR